MVVKCPRTKMGDRKLKLMDEKLEKLTAMGFKLAGRWSRGDAGIFFDLVDCATARNVLYAFVVDGQLMYVGKTVQPLRARMAGYKNPGPTQSTNIRNNKNIEDGLAKGQQIEIFVLPDNGLLNYGGFHVNLAAGLEDSVVREMSPPWNGGRKEAANESLQPLAVEPQSG
jgi:hypothetical protein